MKKIALIAFIALFLLSCKGFSTLRMFAPITVKTTQTLAATATQTETPLPTLTITPTLTTTPVWTKTPHPTITSTPNLDLLSTITSPATCNANDIINDLNGRLPYGVYAISYLVYDDDPMLSFWIMDNTLSPNAASYQYNEFVYYAVKDSMQLMQKNYESQ